MSPVFVCSNTTVTLQQPSTPQKRNGVNKQNKDNQLLTELRIGQEDDVLGSIDTWHLQTLTVQGPGSMLQGPQ